MLKRSVFFSLSLILFLGAEPASQVLAWEPPPGSQLALLAVKRRDEGKYDEAMGLVTKALEVNPRLPEGYYVRGSIYYNQKKYALSKADFNRTLELFPTFPAALGDRARIKFDIENDPQGALLDLSKSLELLKDKTNYCYRGYVYSEIGKSDLAYADFANSIAMDQQYPVPYRNRGRFELQEGKLAASINDLSSAINLEPIASDYKERGIAYFYMEKYDNALADFKKATSLESEYSSLYKASEAYKLLLAGKLTEASNLLSDFDNKSHYASEYYVKGCVELSQGKVATAAYYFNEALNLSKNFPAVYTKLATIKMYVDKDTKGALADLNKSLSICPTLHAYLTRAYLYSSQEKYDMALADLVQALRFDPKNKDVLRLRGKVAYSAENFDQAIMIFTSLLDGDKKDATDLVFRAYAYARSSQLDNALKDLELARKLEPNKTSVHYGLARIYLKQKRTDDAIAELDFAIKQSPNRVDILAERAWVYWEKKKYDEAYADFVRALKLDSNDVESLLGAGLCCVTLRKLDSSKKYLDAAVKLHPKSVSARFWRALTLTELAKYIEALEDINNVLLTIEKDPQRKLTNLSFRALILKAQIQLALGNYKDSIESCNKVLSPANKNLDKSDKLIAMRIMQECNAIIQMSNSTADPAVMVKAAGDYIAKGDPRAKLLDSLFKNKIATKHFVFLSNLPEQKLLYYAKFAEGFIDTIEAQFIHLKESPLTRIYVVANHHDFLDFVYHNFPERHEARAAYFSGPNAIVFGDEDGIGVLSHEIIHKVVTENLPHVDKWAIEGIPVYFEQLFGYYDRDLKLKLKLGLQNPIRYRGVFRKLKISRFLCGGNRKFSSFSIAV
ncbi:MAG: tetratricopeptide repeat protein, partial [Candidatus Obscuribacterales bacterium]|nr:tetratricopeptide repeat protein [Candidatus Obscuribacterales bacterium]